MVLLDTDHLSILEWTGSQPALKLQERLSLVPTDELGTTIISFEQQMRGWLDFIASKREMHRQIDGYRKLNHQLGLYCSLRVMDFDETSAVQFQNLRKSYRRIGTGDLKIAAITLALDAALLTRNFSDFAQIRGLKIEDWTRS